MSAKPKPKPKGPLAAGETVALGVRFVIPTVPTRVSTPTNPNGGPAHA
jgi:hypothetical protein